MAVQHITVQYDVDNSPLEQSKRLAQELAKSLGLSEAEAEKLNKEFEQQSGILQKLRLKEKLLLDARERSNDPRQIRRINQEIRQARRETQALTGETENHGKMLKNLAKLGVAAFAVSRVASFGAELVRLNDTQVKAEEKVKTAIQSTNNAAKLSFKELAREASALQADTLFGDEDILNNATAQLLTFTNIAGDNFKRTQAVALDLATVLDGDLKSSSIQLGKALNDPVANLSALSRSGIQFSEDQKKVIKELANTNRLAEAQGVILDELERQYGGQAKAATVGAGKLTQFSNKIGDLKEGIGGLLIQGIGPMVQGLNDLLFPLQKESDLLREQQTEVNVLTGILLDNNSATETREEAIRMLNEIQPELVKGITAQNVQEDILRQRLAATNQQFENRIRLALAQEKVAALQKSLNEGVEAAVAAEIRINKAFAERFGVEAQRNTAIEEQIRIMRELNQGNIEMEISMQMVENRQDGLRAITEELSFAQKGLVEVQGGATVAADSQAVAVEKVEKATKKASKAVKQFKIDIDSLIEGFAEESPVEQVFKPEKIADALPDMEDIRPSLDGFFMDIADYEPETGGLSMFENLFGSPEEFFESALGTAQQVIGLIGQIQEAQNAKRMRDLDQQEAQELAMAGDNAKQREAVEEKFQKKRQQLEEDAARKRYQIALAEAIVQGALNVIKSLANPAQAILAGFAAAAQIAIIAATGPGFKEGGYTGDGAFGDVAGPVHRGEFVIDGPTTKAMGLRGKSMADFKAMVSPMLISPAIMQQMQLNQAGYTGNLDQLGDRIVKGISREISRLPVDVTVMDEEGYRRFTGSVDTWKFYLNNRIHG